MTYYDTQQQQNSQFSPQQWAAFNSQVAQPYGAWLGAPSMQAFGGQGLGGFGLGGYGLGQAAYGQQYSQYGGQPSIGAFGYNAGWARSLRAGASSSKHRGAASSANSRNRT